MSAQSMKPIHVREQERRDAVWNPIERQRVLLDTLAWAASQRTVQRNTPATRHREERRKLALDVAAAGPVAGTERFPVVRPCLSPAGQHLQINGAQIPCVAYMSYFVKPRYVRQAAQAGIHLYCFPIILGDRGVNTFSGIGPFRPSVWVGENTLAMATPLADARLICDADPEAWLIPRINLDPPSWWETAHPESCCTLPDGSTMRQSFAASSWRTATASILRQVIAALAASDLAPRLVGIHVAGGRTSEWFYHYRPERGFEDDNAERASAFRDWLRARYATDMALQAAWRDPNVVIDRARPADIRGIAPDPSWRDAAAECATLDTFRFHAESMADTIAFFCKTVKDATAGRLLTGAFYGYHAFLNDPRWGHGALARLLQCPDLDGLASPNAYCREPGTDWPPMAAIDSVRQHGKLWFAENDTRTHRTTLLKDVAPQICPPGQYSGGVWEGPRDAWIAEQLLWKNAARMLACGYGGWWFDMWGGWFDDPALLTVLRRHRQLAAAPMPIPSGMEPQICAIFDETVCHADRSFGRLSESLFRNRTVLGRIGAPYAAYLPGDIEALPADRFRLIWILGDLEHSEALAAACRRVTAPGGKLIRTDAIGTHVSGDDWILYPADADAAQASACIGEIAGKAGVHRYLETGDVLYAGRGWIGVHAATAGDKTIRLPFAARVIDVIHDRELADRATQIQIHCKQFESVLLNVRRATE